MQISQIVIALEHASDFHELIGLGFPHLRSSAKSASNAVPVLISQSFEGWNALHLPISTQL